MAVQQLSVFLENKMGRVAEMLGVLGDNEVEILGFTIAESSDYGIARVVVDCPEEAGRFLRDEGFTSIQNPVTCVGLGNGPAALPGLVRLLSEAGMNIEYMYLTRSGCAVIRVDQMDSVEPLLDSAGLCVLDQNDISSP